MPSVSTAHDRRPWSGQRAPRPVLTQLGLSLEGYLRTGLADLASLNPAKTTRQLSFLLHHRSILPSTTLQPTESGLVSAGLTWFPRVQKVMLCTV